MIILKVSDEIIISALLSEKTISAAAKKIGISERSIYNRMQTASFQQEYETARRRVLECTLLNLQGCLNAAAETICQIMLDGDASPQTRLNACNMIFCQYLKFSEHLENCSQKARENPFDIFDPL